MEQSWFYLIKDVGTPTFLVGILTFGWYKLGVKMVQSMDKSNVVIARNNQLFELIYNKLK